ncbi:HD domain-containing protein [Virgisporangium aliadipatigenens]|nr:HD domain-containing protein [Virgisporangium aliadipatigenens]
MTAVAAAPSSVDAARALAERLLDTSVERRAHSAGVAARAAELARAVPPAERELLVAAAWLHDIGYAPDVRRTGFHPLDGALYLAERGWSPRLCALVAHHSGAVHVAPAGALKAFPDECSPVSDALTYADQTVGPWGRRASVQDRMAEMLRRHGPDSAQARAHHRRGPHLLAVAARVEARLAAGPPRLTPTR